MTISSQILDPRAARKRLQQIAAAERARASARDGTSINKPRNTGNAGRKRSPEGRAIVAALTDRVQTCAEIAEKANVPMRSAANILKHLYNSNVDEVELITTRKRGYRRGPKWSEKG